MDMTTVLPLPVAIFAAMRRSGTTPSSGDGSIRRGKNSWPGGTERRPRAREQPGQVARRSEPA